MLMFENVKTAVSLENFLIMKKVFHYPTADHVLIATNEDGKFLHVAVATGRPGPNEIAIFSDRIREDIENGITYGTVDEVDDYIFVIEEFGELLTKINSFIEENENV